MSQTHPLIEGVEAIGVRYRALADRSGLFPAIYRRIQANWTRYREPDRWPTPSNWVLRVAPAYTHEADRHFEKQLQKQIAICLEAEGWGNDVPTASGLVNSRSRQMNVDLAHRIDEGFEFIELKIASDTPYDAAVQILRYAAIYLLYRLEPQLLSRFKTNAMIGARHIALQVLAPKAYYQSPEIDLPAFERQVNLDLGSFAAAHLPDICLSFQFMAFPLDFHYRPGIACASICNAVRLRASAFADAPGLPVSQSPAHPAAARVEIVGCAGQPIRTFAEWEHSALPPERKALHWKEGRSAFELGYAWTGTGQLALPSQLARLLASCEGTRRTAIVSGATEHPTALPFGAAAPRMHDLMLRAVRDSSPSVICIEAKADESFGRTVQEELDAALQRPVTRFPDRLDWLTRLLFGMPAFSDDRRALLNPTLGKLRYQLLAAVAGTLLEARVQRAATAVFVVHEFRTARTEDCKLESNADDLNRFLSFFHRKNGGPELDCSLNPEEMIGPISIAAWSLLGEGPQAEPIPLFIGKIRTDRLV